MTDAHLLLGLFSSDKYCGIQAAILVKENKIHELKPEITFLKIMLRVTTRNIVTIIFFLTFRGWLCRSMVRELFRHITKLMGLPLRIDLKIQQNTKHANAACGGMCKTSFKNMKTHKSFSTEQHILHT